MKYPKNFLIIEPEEMSSGLLSDKYSYQFLLLL